MALQMKRPNIKLSVRPADKSTHNLSRECSEKLCFGVFMLARIGDEESNEDLPPAHIEVRKAAAAYLAATEKLRLAR